jgi:hypothetical protein
VKSRTLEFVRRDEAGMVRGMGSNEAGFAGARPIVLLPTFNERENLDAILAAILDAQP